jgi:UDP-glucose 4-epimerase
MMYSRRMAETVVITGSTGVLGWRAVAALVAGGHTVRAVARSEAGRRKVEAHGADAIEADVFDAAALERAFAGASVVVNLLTRIPPVNRMGMPGAWRENDRLRREASAAIAAAAAAAGARRLVQESVCFVYADGGDRWLDEDAPLEPVGPPAAALDAERNARDGFGGDAVVLRFGALIGPDSDQSVAHLANARRGFALWPGRDDAYVPTLWLDDAGAAIAAAATGAPRGTYNVVDRDPPTRAEIIAALAAASGRSKLRSPPGWLPRVVPPLRPISRSLRLSGQRLADACGWTPAVRGGIDGWALIAAEGSS